MRRNVENTYEQDEGGCGVIMKRRSNNRTIFEGYRDVSKKRLNCVVNECCLGGVFRNNFPLVVIMLLIMD